MFGNMASYYFVDGQYERLVKGLPSTRGAVELSLSAYIIGDRDAIFDSPWMAGRTLKAGETAVRYAVLGFQSIDVIYGPNDEVVEIIPSYE